MRRLGRARIATAGLLVAMVVSGAPNAQGASVLDVRVGEHPDKTRVVLDLDGPAIGFTYGFSKDRRTLFVDFEDAAWQAGEAGRRHRRGKVATYAFMPTGKGGRLAVFSKSPMATSKPFRVKPYGTDGHRLVFDLVDATETRARAPSALSARLIPPAKSPKTRSNPLTGQSAGSPVDEKTKTSSTTSPRFAAFWQEALGRGSTTTGPIDLSPLDQVAQATTEPTGDSLQRFRQMQERDAERIRRNREILERGPEPAGQQQEEAPSSDPRSPKSERVSSFSMFGEEFSVSVTPRVQYYILSTAGLDDSTTSQSTEEAVEFPFYGLTVDIGPHSLPGTRFLFSGFFGEGTHKERTATTAGVSFDTDARNKRLDLEALVRHFIDDTPFSFHYGVRFIEFEEARTAPAGIAVTSSGSNRSGFRENFYLGELGAGFSIPISLNDEHLLFGGGTLVAGYQVETKLDQVPPSDTRTENATVLFDLNIGYQFAISDDVSLHARYRALMGASIDNNISDWFNGFDSFGHGPEIGVTYRF